MTDGQPAQGFRYWAFISYSHADAAWAAWLHRALESYRIPGPLVGLPIAAGTVPTRLRPLFRDRDELPTSADLGYTIEEALRQSWCLVVVCSPAAARSRWVDAEVAAFRALGRGERIHCLIVDGEPGSADLECFPPALAASARADGRRGSEPIGADVRPHGDGRSNARLKLVAGILGLGFDKFIRREQQRRHRVMLLVTVASMLAAVLFATFAIVTITSRRDADAQRRHAEGLVEFMLGDLRRKLEPDGKLATLDAVGKEALAYYAAQDPASLDADALARRARALQQIGEVYNLRGQLDDALGVFRQAAATTAELLAREPDNGQRIFDHAQSVYWVGYIAYQRGDHASAEPQFQQYKTLAERLVAIDPANEAWQAEVGYANSNLGTLLYEHGRLEEARGIFENELAVVEALPTSGKNHRARAMRTAQAHAWLATVAYRKSLLVEATRHRRSEASIYSAMLAIDPNDRDVIDALSISGRSIASLALCQGDIVLARTEAANAVDLAGKLTRLDPDHSQWQATASAASLVLAEAMFRDGQIEASNRALTEGEQLAAELLKRDPTVLDWRLRWIESQILSARLGEGNLDARRASSVLHVAIEQLGSLPVVDGERPRHLPLLLSALSSMAELAAREGRLAEASDLDSKIIELSRDGIQSLGPIAMSAVAMAQSRRGNVDQARLLQTVLDKAGYRNPDYLRFMRESGAMPNPKVARETPVDRNRSPEERNR